MSIKQRIKQYVDQAFAKSSPATEQPKAGPENPQASTEGVITQEMQEAITAAVAEAAGPLRTQLAKAQEDLSAANKLAGERDAEISRLKSELQTANGKVTAAEKERDELKASMPGKVAAGVATVAASQGLPAALPTKATAENPAQPQTKTELKGLAKVRAAFKAQLAAK